MIKKDNVRITITLPKEVVKEMESKKRSKSKQILNLIKKNKGD